MGQGQGGWADPLAHIEVRPGGKASWPPRCPQGSEWNPGSLPSREPASSELSVYSVKAMASRCERDRGPGSQQRIGARLPVTDGEGMKESGLATLARWLLLSPSRQIDRPPRRLPQHLTAKGAGEAGRGSQGPNGPQSHRLEN